MRPPLPGQGDQGARRPRRRNSGTVRRLRQMRRGLPGQGQAGAQRHRPASATAFGISAGLRLARSVVGQRVQEYCAGSVDPGAEATRLRRGQRNRARGADRLGRSFERAGRGESGAAALIGLPDRGRFRAQIHSASRGENHPGGVAAHGALPAAPRHLRRRHPHRLRRSLHQQKERGGPQPRTAQPGGHLPGDPADAARSRHRPRADGAGGR